MYFKENHEFLYIFPKIDFTFELVTLIPPNIILFYVSLIFSFYVNL